MRNHLQCQYLLRVVSWYRNDIMLQCIHSCFIVYQLQISLYFMCIPLPCNCPYLEKNVKFFFFTYESALQIVLNSNAHLKRELKVASLSLVYCYFCTATLLAHNVQHFISAKLWSVYCSYLKEKLILTLEILVQITACLMVFGQRIPNIFTNTQVAILCKIVM